MYQDLSDEIGINKEGRYEVNFLLKFHTQFYQTTSKNVKNVLRQNSINRKMVQSYFLNMMKYLRWLAWLK